jgi:hypothetical protein
MNKEYKYIGDDIEKSWCIAKEVIVGINRYYDICFHEIGITKIDESFIENEPTLWELID